MRKFKQSLCSVSIALALTTSAAAMADDLVSAEQFSSEQEVAAISGNNQAYIMIGEQTASDGNDASIDIQGKYVYSDITIDGNDNVAITEQTKVVGRLQNMMGRTFINGNDNEVSIIQHGYGGAARVDILSGDNNVVNVEQQHFVDTLGAIDIIKVTGFDNTVDALTYNDFDQSEQDTRLTIEGNNNSAFIYKTGRRGWIGFQQNTDRAAYLKGNNNSLNIEMHDTGRSLIWAEFTGDDNIINIEMQGDTELSRFSNKDHVVNMEKSVGNGNTFNINSFASGSSTNLKNFSGNDNQVTVDNLSGYNNRTIKAFHLGDSNVMNFTFNGEGDNQANISKTTENNSTIDINLDGSWNNVARLGATGDRNTWKLSATGHSNKQTASKFVGGYAATTGDDNTFIIEQNGLNNIAEYQDAGNNRYYETIQTGDRNFSSVVGLGDNKRVGVTQIGDDNTADLNIDRTLNHAGDYGAETKNQYYVSQEGDENIVMVDMDASAYMNISQVGSENFVDLQVTSFQEGMSAKDVYYDFSQIGNENFIEVDIKAGLWGKQEYSQTGYDNYISWTDEGGGTNTAAIDQLGASNTVYMTVATFGWSERNKFDIDQEGAYNEVDMDVTGNGNGTGDANVWDGYSAGIVIQQDGEDNLLVGSDGFGFTINGNVNALLVEQVGNGNTAAGFIIGNNNVAQMTQIGNDNFASINISAY